MALLWFVLLPLTLVVNATSRPPGPLGPPAPVSYQDVAFRTADGVRLSAWYIPPRNGAAVVLLPGAGSTCGTVLGRAAVLARHGYGALLTDTRGHGRSGGHAMDFGWWGDRDIAAAVSFLARPPGIQVAPVLAHVLSHATSLVHGAELPPHPHRAPAISTDKVKPQVR